MHLGQDFNLVLRQNIPGPQQQVPDFGSRRNNCPNFFDGVSKSIQADDGGPSTASIS